MNRLAGLATLLVLTLALAGCSYLPEAGALSPSGVTVNENRSYITIVPASGSYASVGLIFVPGGLVDPHAYVQAMSLVATQAPGYAVVIPKEPANLAVLSPNKPVRILNPLPGVSRWAIGGHSLGGVMACTAVNGHRSLFAGLVLEAAYPAKSADLSNWGGPVLSLSGSLDGLATPSDIDAAKPLLPSTTQYHVITGGIHSYFGSYGHQKGDGTAAITRAAQQSEAASLIGSFLGSL